MSQEIGKIKELNYSGLMNFYRSQDPMKSIVIEVANRDEVKPEMLQEALDRTLERMPYYGDTFVEKDGNFYYAENLRPMVVRQAGEYPAVGGAETDYHMIDVRCHENLINVSMYHAFTDGIGIARFLDTLLYYYYCIKDGVEYEPNGTVTQLSSMTDAEVTEPYAAPYPAETPAGFGAPAGSAHYELPEITGKSSGQIVRVKLNFPENELIGLSKSVKSSPGVVISMILGEAVEILHPDHEEPLSVMLPMSQRKALGCPETFKNCLGALKLDLTGPELDRMSFGERAAQLRSAARMQLDENLVRMQANGIIGACHRIAEMPGGYWDKLKAVSGVRAASGSMATVIVDYVKALNVHPYDKDILSYSVFTDPVGLSSTAVPHGGRIDVDLTAADDISCYGDALAEALAGHGIKTEPEVSVYKNTVPCTGWRDILK